MLTRTDRISKPRSFAKDTIILAIAAVIGKVIGAVYRIPLTNILGAEGIGFYQLIFPVYALMITVSSGAIPTALARIISSRTAINDGKSVLLIQKSAMRILLVSGFIFAVLLVLIASPIANAQGNNDLKYGYYLISPAIFIVALSNCFKGYFQGKLNMIPTALAQVTEQFVKLIAGLVLGILLIKKGVFYAVLGAILGVIIAEISSLIILALQYFRLPKSARGTRAKINVAYYRILIRATLPILLSGLFFPLIQFCDSLLIVNILQLRGLDSLSATSQYGLLAGSVNTLVNMPIVIILSMATTIVPYIAKRKAERNCPSIVRRSSKALILANLLALPCCLGVIVLAKPLIFTIYPSLSVGNKELATMLMQISAVTILLLTNMQLFSSLLQGLGRAKAVAYNMLIGGLMKILLDILLMYYFGIKGALYASIISYLVILLLNMIYFKKLLGWHGSMWRELTAQTVNSLIMSGIVILTINHVGNNIIALLVGGIVGVCAYVFLTLFNIMTAKNKAISTENQSMYHVKHSIQPR